MNKNEVIDEYLDVLQNIEAAIKLMDRGADDLIDLEVGDALNELIRYYHAEAGGRTAPSIRLTPLKRLVFEAVKEMCEMRLGRNQLLEAEDGDIVHFTPSPLTPAEIVLCLKRIATSVKFWSKSHGRRGYLDYMGQFVM